MLIDLETYRPRVSETPQIAFRRTEADRRPSTVVARPNDGPGEQREQFARELADKAARKSIAIEGPDTYNARVLRRQHEVKMTLLAFVGSDPEGVNARRCIAFIQTRGDHVNKILMELEASGLINRTRLSENGGLLNTITDDGRSLLNGERYAG